MDTEMVEVKNRSDVLQMNGTWLIPPHGTQCIPLEAVGGFGDAIEVLASAPSTLTIYRSLCKPDCGHSLCILARGLTAELEARGYRVVREPWRPNFDQAPINKTVFCNAASFEGPAGRWAWMHFDNSIAPRKHVAFFQQNFTGNICVSEAVKQGLLAAGVPEEQLRVVPNAIRGDLFCPDGPVMDAWGDRFVFLTAGAMSPRKGMDVALDAYGRAFDATDEVVLAVKNYDYGRDAWCRKTIDAWRKRLGETAPAVHYVYETWAHEDLAAAYRRAARHGAYLAPTRVEGFGLTGLEALACGCRLGMTGWGAQLQYATPENSTLFGYDLRPSENNPDLYEDDERPMWAEPRVDDVVEWMRTMVEESPDKEARAAIADGLRARFTFSAMATGIAEVTGLEGGGQSAAGAPRGSVLPGTPPVVAPQPTTPITRDETLGVAIATRDRVEYLLMIMGALLAQSKLPDEVCIVNDSDRAYEADSQAFGHIVLHLRKLGVRVILAGGTKRGASPNHQRALELLKTDLIMRLDDDLLPIGPDFLGRLYVLLNRQPDIGAVGGVYPRARKVKELCYESERHKPGMTNTVDDMLAGKVGLQFSRWEDEAVVEVEHLYSSYMYRREALRAVGGFADCYSRFGQREETDACVRLNLLGGLRLLVDIQARGVHFEAGGGRRQEASRERCQQDEQTFLARLGEWRQAVAPA